MNDVTKYAKRAQSQQSRYVIWKTEIKSYWGDKKTLTRQEHNTQQQVCKIKLVQYWRRFPLRKDDKIPSSVDTYQTIEVGSVHQIISGDVLLEYAKDKWSERCEGKIVEGVKQTIKHRLTRKPVIEHLIDLNNHKGNIFKIEVVGSHADAIVIPIPMHQK